MGFSTYDDMINEITTNDKLLTWDFSKVSTAPETAGVWHTIWTAVGTPGPGAAPASTPGAACNSLAGSMNWADKSPDTKHLLTFGAVANYACNLMLYDRLVHVGAVSINSTGTKTVNSAALSRYTGTAASGNQVWLEVTTVTAAAAVINVNSYTNEAGTTGRSGGSRTFPAASTNVDTMIGPMPLQSGDYGVRSVETINVGTSGAGSAAVNVVILRPIAFLSVAANVWNEQDFVMQLPSLPRIFDTASLCVAMQVSGSNAVSLWGNVRIGYG